jgi:hypothetical protein
VDVKEVFDSIVEPLILPMMLLDVNKNTWRALIGLHYLVANWRSN